MTKQPHGMDVHHAHCELAVKASAYTSTSHSHKDKNFERSTFAKNWNFEFQENWNTRHAVLDGWYACQIEVIFHICERLQNRHGFFHRGTDIKLNEEGETSISRFNIVECKYDNQQFPTTYILPVLGFSYKSGGALY